MNLSAKERTQPFKSTDTVVLFLTEDYASSDAGEIPENCTALLRDVNLDHFKGKAGDAFFIPVSGKPAFILAGLGKKGDVSPESLRNAAAAAIDICRRRKIRSLCAVEPVSERLDSSGAISSVAEGLCLANYSFGKYKSRQDDAPVLVESVEMMVFNPEKARHMLDEISIITESTLLCRDLVNETSDASNPVAIASDSKKLGRLRGVTCKVYGKREIRKMGMGLLLAVSRGSRYEPRLVVLKYTGNPDSKKSVAIVGKGITFDSGGLNLKPSGHIEDMRSDMAGAAVCLCTIKAAAELRLKKNIYAVMPLCENMLSGNAYRPGDVYISHSGKSVEIGNTDAEGRLILADALSFTEKVLKPNHIIDIATLTGACLICFGEIVAGLFTENDTLAHALFSAGEHTGERLWRLPLYREYNDDIKSDVADIINVSSGRQAGAIIGATFLKNFVKNTPWAHIDIAGTSWFTKQRGYRPKHATGYGVRLFIEAFKNMNI